MFDKKLRPVIRHEYLTVVKQPAFLLTMLIIPVAMAAIIAISYFSGKSSESSIQEAAKKVDNVAVIDASGIVSPEFRSTQNVQLRPVQDRQAVVDEVKNGKLDGAIIYPEDLATTRKFAVYVGTSDFMQSSTLTNLGQEILKASVFAPLKSPDIIRLAQQGATGDVTTYKDGKATAGMKGYIVPGIFVILFYIILIFSVNYMLTSVSEEKENRSMEMVLSYVKPRTLIMGKLFGISLVALTQLVFFGAVTAVSVFIMQRFRDHISLPFNLDLSGLVFDPSAIAVGLCTLVFGFLFFAALMAGTGSMVPSAKDAGSFSSVFIIGALIPFYAASLILTNPHSPVTKFLTFFPTTAPTTILFRNTVDNINGFEVVAAIGVLLLFTVLSFMLAGKLFRLGALEYSNRLSLSALFRK